MKIVPRHDLDRRRTETVGDKSPASVFSEAVGQTPLLQLPQGFSLLRNMTIEHSGSAEETSAVTPENRLVLLGLIMASLPDVPYDDAAKLLRLTPRRLERMVHGSESIPKRLEEQWKEVAEILGLLHTVLKPRATGRWLNTPVARLGGLTPLQAVDKGKGTDVMALVRTYCEPSFT